VEGYSTSGRSAKGWAPFRNGVAKGTAVHLLACCYNLRTVERVLMKFGTGQFLNKIYRHILMSIKIGQLQLQLQRTV
jgi:hypothetical protein